MEFPFMEKIQITDLIDDEHKQKHPRPEDKALVLWKKKKRASFFKNAAMSFFTFAGVLRKALNRVKPQPVISFIKNLNVYRKLRERLVRFYLKRTVATLPIDRVRLTIFWQPVPLILCKVAIVAAASYWLYTLFPILGKWLREGFDFFKLQDIYNFEFPKQTFFDSIALYLLLFIIAYHGLYFLYHELSAFLSVLVVNEAEAKVYLVRSVFVKKVLYVFAIPEIALVILRQNIVARIFGIGTISLEKKSGDLVEIRSIAGARKAVRLLSQAYGK
jgi:hypothetical protein